MCHVCLMQDGKNWPLIHAFNSPVAKLLTGSSVVSSLNEASSIKVGSGTASSGVGTSLSLDIVGLSGDSRKNNGQIFE